MKKHRKAALLCGLLGCLCYGGGDWLMMYGNPAYHGALSWLTEGVTAIPQWRYDLAMVLAFPGIILYGMSESMILWFGVMLIRERRRTAA